MADFFLRQMKGTAIPGLMCVGGRFTTSTSGAISGTADVWGCTVTKTASETGRYTVTLPRPSQKLLMADVCLVGPDDAALTTTKGLIPVVRDDDIATDGTVEIQFVTSNSGNADTEVQDGALVRFMLWLVDTSVS